MSSPAHKQAESEFDDLLGQLVDELAMTPASESAVSLVPDPPPAEARVDSTNQMAAEAAAAAAANVRPAPSSNNLVKVVGIITGALTVVAVAALVVFAGGEEPNSGDQVAAVADEGDRALLEELAATEQAAVERAQADRMAAERAELAARVVRVEAGLLARDHAETQPASKPKPRVRKRAKPKPKPKPTVKPSDSFEDL